MLMSSTRRTFLASVGLAAALPLAAAPTRVRAGCVADAETFDELITLLRKLRDLGYSGFSANLKLLQTQSGHLDEVRGQLSEIGLDLIGVRTLLPRYNEMENDRAMDELSRVAMAAKQFGARSLMMHSGGLAPDGKFTASALAAKIKFFNQAAKRCGETGVYFNYRTQGVEFRNDGAEVKGLIAGTEKNVYFDFDLDYATRAYPAAVEVFNENPGRTYAMEGQFTEGIFKVHELAAAVKKNKWISWLIESSPTPNEASRSAMKKAFGA